MLNKYLPGKRLPVQITFRKLILFIALIFIAGSALSQNYLTVRSQNRPKRFRFDYGDYIGVKLEGKGKIYQGELQGFTDSTIYIAGSLTSHVIRLDEIRVVKDYRWKNFTETVARSALYTIPFFLIGETLTGSSPSGEGAYKGLIARPGYFLSVIYGGFAAILYPIKGRRFRIGNRWKLLVIRPFGN